MTSPRASLLADTLTRRLRSCLGDRPLLVWLDSSQSYTAFVDALAESSDLGPCVVRFRGSYLETMLELEGRQAGVEPEPMVLHLPGLTDSSVRETPFLSLYRAGRRFEHRLDTLLGEAAAGVVDPDQLEAFVATHPCFDEAEAWLEAERSREQRALGSKLARLEPAWVLGALLGDSSELRQDIEQAGDPHDLHDYLARHTGLSAAFCSFVTGEARPRSLRSLTDAVVSWLQCVEYVHDLRREPVLEVLAPLRRLAAPLRDTSLRLCGLLHERYREVYRTQALVTEAQLGAELAAGTPDELGRLDTFRGENTRLLEASIEALLAEAWDRARTWAELHLQRSSLWLENDPGRRHEWEQVLSAARFGEALSRHPQALRGAASLEEALHAYTGSGVLPRTHGAQQVDRAHRQFEELRRRKVAAHISHAAELHRVTTLLRTRYRAWVDALARAFAALCSREGFVPPAALQQRTLYEQVVHPLVQRDATRCALFLVDALRYEMAAELAGTLDDTGVTVQLGARYCELPSITAVGMNALAPMAPDGRLVLASAPQGSAGAVRTPRGGVTFTGFKRSDSFVVRDPATRVRAMAERSLAALPGARKSAPELGLGQLIDLDPESVRKRIAGHSLVVVHSKEIDEAGESGTGLATFDTWLGQLRAAVHKLRQLGITELVLTADHGFLLQDETCSSQAYLGGREQDRRYAVLDEGVAEPDMTGATLAQLGYDGVDGYLRLACDTRVFNASGRSSSSFVHGGNTLQERVIPVLTVSVAARARASVRPSLTRYCLRAELGRPVMGSQRIRVRLEVPPNTTELFSFPDGREVAIGLRAVDTPAQVHITDTAGCQLSNQQLLLGCGRDWAEVFFTLSSRGPSGVARAQVELYHPDGEAHIEPVRLEPFFEVQPDGGALQRTASPQGTPSAPPGQSDSWQAGIADDGHRRALVHLDAHGTISEEQLLQMLGSARAARQFSLRLEGYRDRLPFAVSLDTSAGGKRYIKGVG